MDQLYNKKAVLRIQKDYPHVARSLPSLIKSIEKHEAGSGEIALRYDKPEDTNIGKYDIVLIVRVQLREVAP